jgi:hypothetical protein
MARGADDGSERGTPSRVPARKPPRSPYPWPPPYPVLPPLSRPAGHSGGPDEQPEAPPWRWLVWVLAVVVGGGGFPLALMLSYIYAVECGGSDVISGAAPDSQQGQVCTFANESTIYLPLVGWLAGLVVLIWICARWTLRRTNAFWVAWAMALPLVVPTAVFAGLNAPSNVCGADKRSDPACECEYF